MWYNYWGQVTLHRFDRDKEALPILESLASRFPKVSRYHHSLGIIYRYIDEKEKALDSFRSAIALATPTGKLTALCSLADYLCELGLPKEALPIIDEALEINPNDSYAVTIASRVYWLLSDPQKALDIILEGLRTSTDSRLHHRAGIILKNLGLLKDAIPHLEKASLSPIHSLSTLALADIYIELEDYEKANEVVESFKGNKFLNVSYLTTKANILDRQSKYDEALYLLNKAYRLRPDDNFIISVKARVLYHIALDLIKNNQKQKALIVLKEALLAVREALIIDPEDSRQLELKHTIENELGRDKI